MIRSIEHLPMDQWADGRVDFRIIFGQREDYIAAGRQQIEEICSQVCEGYWTMGPKADVYWNMPLSQITLSFTLASDAMKFKLALVL
jgi:hypothetical protein